MTVPRPTAWTTALSRRKALSAAGSLAAGLAGTRLAGAQEATPAPAADDAERIFTMFVQTAQGGHFAPKPGEDGVYQLVLRGATAQTVYFSDRPHRLVGSVSTADFLAGLGFSPENPPNAAIVAQTEDGGEDVIVVELLNPDYDSGSQTLTYDVIVLDEYIGDGFGDLAQRQDDGALPEAFGHTSLFIDDCPPITQCVNDVDSNRGFQRWSAPIPGGPYATCWYGTGPNKQHAHCVLCDNSITRNQLAQRCTDAYPDDCPHLAWYACDPR
jgi:hypothetical protein